MDSNPQARIANMVQQANQGTEAGVNRVLDMPAPISTTPQQPSIPDTQPPISNIPADGLKSNPDGVETTDRKGFFARQKEILQLKSKQYLKEKTMTGIDNLKASMTGENPGSARLEGNRAPVAPVTQTPKPDLKTPSLPAMAPMPKLKFK